MESTKNRLSLGGEEQLRILTKLSDAEILEQFIQRSYGAGTKRFSLEGAESLIPLLDLLVEQAGEFDVEEMVLGMAHRGRLNVLVNIMDKSVREVFAAFEDADPERFLGGGDVKYHLGYSTDRVTATGKYIHLTMTFNPSHLEFVNPVVEGRIRAKQERLGLGPIPLHKVMPLLIHGDAAFMGQGIVAETLNLTNLVGYTTGGTVHVIVNNQIGFTTDVEDSRSTRYASDITRMLKVPVFHVNGEDPEAVAQVAHLAVELRQRFGTDVVIDMYCYRRHGHNEGDEPRYTQPLMYQAIDRKPTVRQVYVRRLVQTGHGHVTEDSAEAIVLKRREALAAALEDVKQRGFAPVTYAMGGVWSSYRGGPDAATPEVGPRSTRTASSPSRSASWSCRRASTPTPRCCPSSALGTRRSPRASPSTGGRGRCSRTPRSSPTRRPCACRGRTCGAAPSATATRCSSTRRRASPTPRSPASPSTPAASRSTTAPSRSRASSASTSATASTTPRRS